MKLNRLSLQDKTLFNRYLGACEHELSVYAFEDIYIWKGLFRIYWAQVQKSLCVFFQDRAGAFLYLPPLGKQITPELIREIFQVLDSLNQNKAISRIENVEEKDLSFYRQLGFACVKKSFDYVCLRQDLVGLKGSRYKSKRSCLNYFLKHYEFQDLPYKSAFHKQCLELYLAWAKARSSRNNDPIYRYMLEDSCNALKVLLRNFKSLNCIGRVVKVKGEIKAFTIGYQLNPETFCILYEVADLSFKGLAQFIFREFCAGLKDFKYINVMDDSGLKNLEQVKFSYKPVKLVPAFIVKRKNE
ncbi:MAG: phosphatidylglycerol lysyltransferase domain-containing protein [Candidatus Omnitrophica bacterium]|nr:phosphatidylglycerol lysyltransferase domain-containing protein [Candidatus Omnitrophota bacterium]